MFCFVAKHILERIDTGVPRNRNRPPTHAPSARGHRGGDVFSFDAPASPSSLLLVHHLSSIICCLSPLRTGVLAVFIKLPLPLFVLSRVPQLHGVPSTPQASLRLFALASFHLTRPLHRNSRSHSRAAELNLHVFFYLSSSRTFRGVQTAVQTPGEFTYIHDCMCSGVPSTKALDILSI